MTLAVIPPAFSDNRALMVSLGSVFLVWLIGYFEAIESIVEPWLENGTYSHGFLSLGLALFITYKQLAHIHFRERVDWKALVLLLGFSVGVLLGDIANVLKVQQLSAMLMLTMLLVLFFGWRVLLVLKFPLIMLYLVIPVWDFLLVPLQNLSTNVAFGTVRFLGIPALLEGHQITMPGGRFVVEEACSGLGFFLCAITLGAFYVYLNQVRGSKLWLLLAICAGTAIVANWIRILAILLVGNEYGMDHPVVTDHLTFGWIVFSVALLPLYFICLAFFPPEYSQGIEKPKSGGDTVVAGLNLPALILMLVVLLPAPMFGIYLDQRTPDFSPALVFPETLGNFSIVPATMKWESEFIGASQVLVSGYSDTLQMLTVLAVVFDEQDQERELINVNNKLYMSPWNELDEETAEFDGNSIRIATIGAGHRQQRIAYWYVIGDAKTSSRLAAKVLDVKGVLTGNTRAMLVAVRVETTQSNQSLWELVRPFYFGIE